MFPAMMDKLPGATLSPVRARIGPETAEATAELVLGLVMLTIPELPEVEPPEAKLRLPELVLKDLPGLMYMLPTEPALPKLLPVNRLMLPLLLLSADWIRTQPLGSPQPEMISTLPPLILAPGVALVHPATTEMSPPEAKLLEPAQRLIGPAFPEPLAPVDKSTIPEDTGAEPVTRDKAPELPLVAGKVAIQTPPL